MNKFQQMGIVVTIPFILATPPIVGWFIGKWLDKKLDTAPYLMYILIFLGLLAGVIECYRVIKAFGNEE
jgi:ATP synthase protein I